MKRAFTLSFICTQVTGLHAYEMLLRIHLVSYEKQALQTGQIRELCKQNHEYMCTEMADSQIQ